MPCGSRANPAAAASSRSRCHQPRTDRRTSTFRRPMSRILIVEDDEAIAVALEDDLRLEGYEVEVASDGEAAVTRARAASFDLILLDVMLPKRDGFEVCRALRRSGVASPILMLTARAQESDRVLGLDLGADDYVTKPVQPEGTASPHPGVAAPRVTGRERGRRHSLRGLRDRLCSRRASVRGQSGANHATRVQAPGAVRATARAVLTRRTIIDEAWGKDTVITERVVDNQIANLRRKIERSPDAPQHLKSIRGLGYRFDPETVTES